MNVLEVPSNLSRVVKGKRKSTEMGINWAGTWWWLLERLLRDKRMGYDEPMTRHLSVCKARIWYCFDYNTCTTLNTLRYVTRDCKLVVVAITVHINCFQKNLICIQLFYKHLFQIFSWFLFPFKYGFLFRYHVLFIYWLV